MRKTRSFQEAEGSLWGRDVNPAIDSERYYKINTLAVFPLYKILSDFCFLSHTLSCVSIQHYFAFLPTVKWEDCTTLMMYAVNEVCTKEAEDSPSV